MEPERSERGHLDRESVVAAAIAIVDAEGLDALSMRRLGSDLGVEAMALYRYVNGREDLLEAIVDRVTSEVRKLDDMDLGPHGSWQAYLQGVAHAVKDLAMRHPKIFPLVATRHPAAPWLRPPLRNLEVVEDFLRTLTGMGFSEDQAVAAYRIFTSFLLGQLLFMVAERSDAPLTAETLDEGGASVANDDTDMSEFPTILRLRPKLQDDQAENEFEDGLEHVLGRIEAAVSQ